MIIIMAGIEKYIDYQDKDDYIDIDTFFEYDDDIILSEDDKILQYYITQQIKSTDIDKKIRLYHSDIVRLVKNLKYKSIFDDDCVIYEENKNVKLFGFFLNNEKRNLHRVLYSNFVKNLESNENIRLMCKNNSCCCLKHMKIKIKK